MGKKGVFSSLRVTEETMRKGALAGYLNSVQWKENKASRLPEFIGHSIVYEVIFRMVTPVH